MKVLRLLSSTMMYFWAVIVSLFSKKLRPSLFSKEKHPQINLRWMYYRGNCVFRGHRACFRWSLRIVWHCQTGGTWIHRKTLLPSNRLLSSSWTPCRTPVSSSSSCNLAFSSRGVFNRLFGSFRFRCKSVRLDIIRGRPVAFLGEIWYFCLMTRLIVYWFTLAWHWHHAESSHFYRVSVWALFRPTQSSKLTHTETQMKKLLYSPDWHSRKLNPLNL